jgi:uncharacterized OB-fold protein
MVELSIPFFWRREKQRYRLVGGRCERCSKISFPESSMCAECGGVLSELKLSGSGNIVSWSTIHVSPEGFEPPYTVAIVELDEGLRICGQLVGDMKNISCGTRVRAVFRKIMEHSNGYIVYGLKFEVIS